MKLALSKSALIQAVITLSLAAVLSALDACSQHDGGDEFVRLMNVGKSQYDKGDAPKAIASFAQAVKLLPTHIDARLNLANAYLLVGQPNEAITQAQEALNLEPNSGAAHYLIGCANLRLSKFEDAIKALQTAKDIDRTVNAASFQLGRAFLGANKLEDAAQQFQEVTQFETNHPAAFYNLSQVLVRLGRADEANQALAEHQKILSQRSNTLTDISTYERCIYTQARTPFVLDQPEKNGIKVQFVDATVNFFGDMARKFHGPIGVIDIDHRGANDLFVREDDASFRLLMNERGRFTPKNDPLAAVPGANYFKVLVGDLNNDRTEDVIVIGDKGVQAFRFATNGAVNEATLFANLKDSPATDGALLDLDFTGKLDLLLIPPGSNAVRVLRNLGNMYFIDVSATSGVPSSINGPRGLAVEDWNNDDIMDVFVARDGQPPLLLTKQRGANLTVSNSPAQWPSARALAAGDLNNDLRPDLLLASETQLVCTFNGLTNNTSIPLNGLHVDQLTLSDYDNDGWLDIIAVGDGLRVWRNLGRSGFRDTTAELGLDKLISGKVDSLALADFDNDCDTDLIVSVAGRGLVMLRNDGGNVNRQIKLRLFGNRSNASGLGVRVEATAGHWRTLRTMQRFPFEIGVGNRRQLDSLTVRWFDIAWNQAEINVAQCDTLTMTELMIPTGSCPYLYAWNGQHFRFVTDLLGASPLGLPVAPGRYIDADPDEFVWIGNEDSFKPRDGFYILQITEELREVLYLDEAKLVVVDHPAGTEIYPTDKLLPGTPFPPSELVALHHAKPLLRATRHDGLDATDLLKEADRRVVSPAQLRDPQLRGLAEPHSVTLDFGPLEIERPLVLGLTGWLRFGGGMANIGASRDPNLPFPFPVLEAQTPDGRWQKLDVIAGTPAGKTKRMFIDLTGKLPRGSRQLRLSAAFEIHWDQAVLFEKPDRADVRQVTLLADKTDLHWRGFGEFENLPSTQPLTPSYDKVHSRADWRITPSGWCTRYGPVDELVTHRDNALVLINGGDELTLSFNASKLPPKPAGYVREFFLYSVGWDKDADFHVKHGTTVGPLPFHGMDDQHYGEQPRPAALSVADTLMERFNTRWVGPMTFTRVDRREK